jgi:hypothetical protein
MTGSLTFDSAVVGTDPAPGLGYYPAPISSFSVSVSGKSFSYAGSSFIQVNDNWSGSPTLDQYNFGVEAVGPLVASSFVPRLFQVAVANWHDPSAILGVSLPGDDLTLARFPDSVFSFSFGDPGGGPNYKVGGRLTSFEAPQANSVPEPTSVVIFVGLLVGVIAVRAARGRI